MPHLKYCVQFGAFENKWGMSKKRSVPEGHHAGQGARVRARKEPERTNFPQYGEEKEKEHLVAALSYLEVAEKWGSRVFFGETLQKEKGQKSQAVTKEIWLKNEKKKYSQGKGFMGIAVEEGRRPWATWYNIEVNPVLSRSLNQIVLRGPFQSNFLYGTEYEVLGIINKIWNLFCTIKAETSLLSWLFLVVNGCNSTVIGTLASAVKMANRGKNSL